MSLATDYLTLNFGHHTLKWHLERIRVGSATPEQIALSYQPNIKNPEFATIKKGLEQLLKMKTEDLPEGLR